MPERPRKPDSKLQKKRGSLKRRKRLGLRLKRKPKDFELLNRLELQRRPKRPDSRPKQKKRGSLRRPRQMQKLQRRLAKPSKQDW